MKRIQIMKKLIVMTMVLAAMQSGTLAMAAQGNKDFPPYDKYDLEYGTCHGFRGLVGYQMTRLCIDRHDMAINMTFVDGSVQKVWLKDLWKFPWHKNFQTKSYSRMPVR